MMAEFSAPLEQPTLAEQYTEATIRVAELDTARVQQMSYEDRMVFRKQVGEEADELLGRFGLEPSVVMKPYDGKDYRPTEYAKLRRAADIAGEAIALGFDLSLSDDDLFDTTMRMFDDLIALRDAAKAAKAGNGQPPERYSERRDAKQHLLQAAALEVSRRAGMRESLTVNHLRALENATGLPFAMYYGGYQLLPQRWDATAKPVRRDEGEGLSDWYRIPQLAGPYTPHRGGLVPGRIGSFALDPRYTGGRLPR